MAEARAKILPKGRVRARIVRRKEQCQHQEQSSDASRPHPETDRQPQPDGKFTVCREESKHRRMWQHKAAEHRRHEGINPSFEKLVDPELESAVKGEFRAEDFVLAENQKENSDANTEYRQGVSVAGAGIGTKSHRDSQSISEILRQQLAPEG